VAIAYTNLGLVAERQERWDDASGYYTQALEIARGVGDERLVGIVLNNLAGVALIRDQGNEAVPAIEESIAHHRRLDDPLGEAGAQINLGAWFTDSHQPEAARSAFLTAVKLARGQGNVYILLRALAALALGEHRANQPEMAVRLHALARAARGDLPESVHSPRHLREIKRSLEQLRDTVDPAVFDRAWKEGASLSLDDLLATLGSGGRDESPEAKSS
jgi:tetratricopeptide (TPR) repeat protein